MALNIGDDAPDFTLTDDSGHEFTLSQLRGKKVILFFYPKDNTPGCTKEACDFRDRSAKFNDKNVEIIGISRDNAASHTKFKTKYNLPFILLIDENGDVCEAYGVINKKSLFGNTSLGIERSTFLIDETGKIQAVWRKVKVKNHVDKILEEVTEYDEIN